MKGVCMMWAVLDSLLRTFNVFWRDRGNMSALTEKFHEQSQSTTDESIYESDEDSGFADDEGLWYTSNESCKEMNSQRNHSAAESESEDDNDFVLDSDVKNQQKITLLSLLYSRALERKLSGGTLRKPLREHVKRRK